MAKYVEYTPDVRAQPDGPTNVFWFPTTFSQSQLGDRIIGSNACTLIAVLLAGRLNEFKIIIWGYQDQPLSRMLVSSLAEAIIEGNEIHESFMAAQQNCNSSNYDLTLPEALRASKHKFSDLVEWGDKTTYSMETLSSSLSSQLLPPILEFEHNPPADKKPNTSLFAILIVDGRSVLWVYQPETAKITMIDSHAHTRLLAGAVVAQARVGDVDNICDWFCRLLDSAFLRGSQVQPYELAWLYVRQQQVER